MADAKHTPGPWVADGLTIFAPNGYRVCRLTEPHKNERGKERVEANEYRAGNAALIAAAPELLAQGEAVKTACDWLLSNIGHVSGIEPQRRAVIAALNKLEAATFKVINPIRESGTRPTGDSGGLSPHSGSTAPVGRDGFKP